MHILYFKTTSLLAIACFILSLGCFHCAEQSAPEKSPKTKKLFHVSGAFEGVQVGDTLSLDLDGSTDIQQLAYQIGFKGGSAATVYCANSVAFPGLGLRYIRILCKEQYQNDTKNQSEIFLLLDDKGKQKYQLVFFWDELSFPDMDRDGTPEIWIEDNMYAALDIQIYKKNSVGNYVSIFKHRRSHSTSVSCFGFDASIRIQSQPGQMPRLLVDIDPRFSGEGTCFPATAGGSAAASQALVDKALAKMKGRRVFVFKQGRYKSERPYRDLFDWVEKPFQ